MATLLEKPRNQVALCDPTALVMMAREGRSMIIVMGLVQEAKQVAGLDVEELRTTEVEIANRKMRI